MLNKKTVCNVFFYTLQKAVEIRFTNAVCESFNKTAFEIHKCRIKAVNRYRNTFNLNSTMYTPIYEERVNIQFFKRANGFKPWLYNINIDGCKFLGKPYNPIFLIIYKQFKNFSNFMNMRCPLQGPAIIENFYIRSELIKIPIPTGDYLLFISWYFNKKLTAHTNVTFQFKEDYINL
ncbi:hypothetical protein KR044_008031, partial [Drosophila immigrans]